MKIISISPSNHKNFFLVVTKHSGGVVSCQEVPRNATLRQVLDPANLAAHPDALGGLTNLPH